MANGLPVDIDTFRKLESADAKLDALFDVLTHMHSSGFECAADRERHRMDCDRRFSAIESRKWNDRGLSGGMGLIGGFLASLFKVQ